VSLTQNIYLISIVASFHFTLIYAVETALASKLDFHVSKCNQTKRVATKSARQKTTWRFTLDRRERNGVVFDIPYIEIPLELPLF